jgi:hypothetical protein
VMEAIYHSVWFRLIPLKPNTFKDNDVRFNYIVLYVPCWRARCFTLQLNNLASYQENSPNHENESIYMILFGCYGVIERM